MSATDDDQGVSLRRFLQLALMAVGIFIFLHLYVFESIVIASASMEPALPVGTHAFLDKLTLRLRDPRRGEIIVFRPPDGGKAELTKRVIGVPGDSVELRDKVVFLNGAELAEPFARHKRAGERLEGDSLEPIALPKGCFFVLGDNRDESSDSSVWKDASGRPAPCVARDAIKGVVRGFF